MDYKFYIRMDGETYGPYSAKEIKEILEQNKNKTSIYIIMGVLKYLKKGGRITPTAAAIGTLLNIKPILVKDYPYYDIAKSILEIAKNEMGDIEIIKMSYLEFLFNLLKTNEMYINWFLNNGKEDTYC